MTGPEFIDVSILRFGARVRSLQAIKTGLVREIEYGEAHECVLKAAEELVATLGSAARRRRAEGVRKAGA